MLDGTWSKESVLGKLLSSVNFIRRFPKRVTSHLEHSRALGCIAVQGFKFRGPVDVS